MPQCATQAQQRVNLLMLWSLLQQALTRPQRLLLRRRELAKPHTPRRWLAARLPVSIGFMSIRSRCDPDLAVVCFTGVASRSVVCHVCGDAFWTQAGLKIHAGKRHTSPTASQSADAVVSAAAGANQASTIAASAPYAGQAAHSASLVGSPAAGQYWLHEYSFPLWS